MPRELIITCEHAGNLVPKKYESLFSQSAEVLNSHEGWDPGAWDIALYLGHQLNVVPFGCHTTRLLIEANRSLYSHQLFSRYTTHLDDNKKEILIKEVYNPYRQNIQLKIDQLKKPVLHLSIHSFTPLYHGKERTVELGLLFDPNRKSENEFCRNLKLELNQIIPDLKVMDNEPYLGIDDGLTSYFRSLYSDDQYLGIEIEVNQKFIGDLSQIEQSLTQGIKKSCFPD